MLTLETPVQFVKGIGPAFAKSLAEKNIATVEDLLLHLPFRYEDRLNPRALSELKPGETASLIGQVRGAALLRTKRMPIFEMTVGQGLSSLKCMWFHGTWLEGKFHAGQIVALYGKVEASRSGRGFKMIQPQFEIIPDGSADALDRLLEVGRITPVYESLGGNRLVSRWIRRTLWNLLGELRGCFLYRQRQCRQISQPQSVILRRERSEPRRMRPQRPGRILRDAPLGRASG